MLRAIGLRALRLLPQPRLSQWHQLAAAPKTPQRFWRDAALYKVPGCPPAPGQPRLAPPRRCRRALGLRAGASGRSLSAAPGMGIALARRARGGHAPHGGICPPLIDVFIQAGFWIFPQEHSLKCVVEPCVAMGTPGGLRMKSLTGPGVVWRRKSRGPVCHWKYWQLCPQSFLFPPAEERQGAGAGPCWGMRGSANLSGAAEWVGCRSPSELLWHLRVWLRSWMMICFRYLDIILKIQNQNKKPRKQKRNKQNPNPKKHPHNNKTTHTRPPPQKNQTKSNQTKKKSHTHSSTCTHIYTHNPPEPKEQKKKKTQK